ncbi:MAG: flagellar biosynthesis protein FlhF [Lachnospiraceae bacterium]
MIIKKFQGKTEDEAVAAAKKELGSNVVIMNVKNTKKKGVFFFLKRPFIEVTAALEEEPAKAAPKPVPSRPLAVTEPREHDVTPAFSEGRGDRMLEEKLESLHSLIEQQLVKESMGNGEEFNEEEDKNVAFLKLIYNTLIENEIDEKYVNELMEEIEKINKPNATIDYVLANIYQKMILKFGQPKTILPARNGAKIVFFIGPTGVGKTTTIAKIASRLSVNEKKKVALLTADTYRIAAAEQLRTYAGILDAPFRVIYSAEELTMAVKAFQSYDYILIDTAGHSHNNEMQKNGMNQLIRSIDESIEKEVYLVVSATTKYKDLVGITDSYLTLMDYKLIFTKLDETKTLGNLFNLRLHTGADLSYITCGQNVPDDIEQFSPQSIVKQLLGGK